MEFCVLYGAWVSSVILFGGRGEEGKGKGMMIYLFDGFEGEWRGA